MKIRESVPAAPVIEPLRWPDEDEHPTVGSVEGAGELACACLISDAGMQASLAREFYSLGSK